MSNSTKFAILLVVASALILLGVGVYIGYKIRGGESNTANGPVTVHESYTSFVTVGSNIPVTVYHGPAADQTITPSSNGTATVKISWAGFCTQPWVGVGYAGGHGTEWVGGVGLVYAYRDLIEAGPVLGRYRAGLGAWWRWNYHPHLGIGAGWAWKYDGQGNGPIVSIQGFPL